MAKNKALQEAGPIGYCTSLATHKPTGAVVPESFDSLDTAIRDTFAKLLETGDVALCPEPPAPSVPMDYTWARVG